MNRGIEAILIGLLACSKALAGANEDFQALANQNFQRLGAATTLSLTGRNTFQPKLMKAGLLGNYACGKDFKLYGCTDYYDANIFIGALQKLISNFKESKKALSSSTKFPIDFCAIAAAMENASLSLRALNSLLEYLPQKNSVAIENQTKIAAQLKTLSSDEMKIAIFSHDNIETSTIDVDNEWVTIDITAPSKMDINVSNRIGAAEQKYNELAKAIDKKIEEWKDPATGSI